ncbi:MAG: 30S ribosomal protein S9 [Spirochaetales bacterium]|nr:30S ribosomal protein S9 [Spirochaetales bacterium]
MSINLACGTGRRKTSVARVYFREGSGVITVNGRKADEYFDVSSKLDFVKKPLQVCDAEGKYDLLINVKGGGINGQAGACAHGIARALVELDENNRPTLRKNGLLTRDSRMVERKKYGQKKARRRFQFSKR